jgi:hypothetical protein
MSDMSKDHLRYQCSCGALYRITPKEIPLAKDEVIFCNCGRLVQGKHSTKYFDYEAFEGE